MHVVPADPVGTLSSAWRRCVGTGRMSLSLLRAAAEPDVEHGSLDLHDGRVRLDLALARHEVTLVEVEPVHDATPPWLDDARVPGYGHGTDR